MANIRIEFGKKDVFKRLYDAKDVDSVKRMVRDYMAFYAQYRNNHTISARTWRFPSVVIDGEEKYKVTPNGSWFDENTQRNIIG